ncbi:hypothetical protein T12_10424 [Trichinella patagoniensis]|uniref:Uncharacterized protein n=1 Tax=Trichinella patagoniensis TaxID=990121 RepID=A0A0V0ZAI1_9BILA|nr:hypothetical protein T12_10424 [Trichinella patagoniensis]
MGCQDTVVTCMPAHQRISFEEIAVADADSPCHMPSQCASKKASINLMVVIHTSSTDALNVRYHRHDWRLDGFQIPVNLPTFLYFVHIYVNNGLYVRMLSICKLLKHR